GDRPKSHALLALLCFHAARLPGRLADDGALIQLEVQDRSKWDRDLIVRGFHFLEKASTGYELSEYHVEAGIASLHCAATSYEDTDWSRILELYDNLYHIKSSPIVALNRAVATGKALGPEEGLAELSKIPDAANLTFAVATAKVRLSSRTTLFIRRPKVSFIFSPDVRRRPRSTLKKPLQPKNARSWRADIWAIAFESLIL